MSTTRLFSDITRFVRKTLTSAATISLLVAASACGNGTDPRSELTERRVEDFVSVYLSEVLVDLGVEAPGLLVLEDSEGQERFHLTEEEYQQVLDIVFEQEFREAIANQSASQEACHTVPDGERTTIVVWADVGTQAARWGICADKNHPYERLTSLLYDLLKKYMDCPRVDPETPSIRGLCRGCWSYPLDGPYGQYAC